LSRPIIPFNKTGKFMKKPVQSRTILLEIMKITALQLIVAIIFSGMAFAREGIAQDLLNQNVRLKFENEKLRTVLHAIERQVNAKFVYRPKAIKADRLVSLEASGQKLSEILPKILSPLRIDYRIVEGQIILTPSAAEQDEKGDSKASSQLILNPRLQVSADVAVSGTVIDMDGNVLPGVSILLKGTQSGTTTNQNGKYALTVPDENPILVFSFVGYMPQEVNAGNRTRINITLKVDTKVLNEVVVVGYGTGRKSDLTSSISTVDSEDLNKVAAPSALQQLQGRAPGVVVTTNSHRPGANVKISIRGNGSLGANSEPLILVDQLRQEGISNINPADIESMTILKDAAATAIYGAQGANGVILITTKQGAAGKTKINYDSYYGMQTVPKLYDLADAQGHATVLNEYAISAGLNPFFDQKGLDTLGTSTNWQKEIYRTGTPIQSHTISASGGNDKTNFYISGNFFNQQGVLINTDFKRYSFRANVSNQASEKLRIGSNLNIAASSGKQAREGFGSSVNAGPVDAAFQFSPIFRVLNADGSYTKNTSIPGLALVDNPVQLARDFVKEGKTYQVFGNAFVEFEIMKGLTVKSDLGAGTRTTKDNEYIPVNSLRGQNLGIAELNSNFSYNWRIFNVLNYKKVFAGGHNLELLLGQEAWESVREGISASAKGFATDDLTFNSIGQGNGDLDAVDSNWSRSATDSYFGRLNYSFKGKLLLNVTVRNDGASVFGKNFKRGWFPAASVGYRLSEENFIKKMGFISNLKLKASYGISGTPGIEPFRSLALIGSPLSLFPYSFGDQAAQVSGFVRLGNPELRWEVSRQSNVGLEIGLLEDRFTFAVEMYNRNTEDLILGLPLAPSTGFINVLSNSGSMNNQGLELSANLNLLKGMFSWNINANAAYNRNKVTKLGKVGTFYSGVDTRAIQNVNVAITKVGEPIGSFFGYVTDGIYQNLEEVKEASLPNGTLPYSNAGPGTYRFVDMNGDGRINDSDRTILGNGLPDWTGGLTNSFGYKNFDFSVFLTFSQGNELLNLRGLVNEGGDVALGVPSQRYLENRWRGEGTSDTYQRPGVNPNDRRLFDLLIEDGSYIRARDMTLGYNFNFTNRPVGKYMRSLRLYASLQNAFTITNYSGYDPEVNTVGTNNIFSGIDNGSYPSVRTLLFGVNLGL
jgi:TonB-dependent starch-binding outer membrane protein SusC